MPRHGAEIKGLDAQDCRRASSESYVRYGPNGGIRREFYVRHRLHALTSSSITPGHAPPAGAASDL
jgi:hypothetical protein